MTHDIIVTLATLGVIGQIVAGLLVLFAVLWLVGVRAPCACDVNGLGWASVRECPPKTYRAR